MRPFLGFSGQERMFFAMLHDRSELEASIKEGSLLLLGELEYLLLIDNPKIEVEWSMEMGKDYFSFPIPIAGGGNTTCYVAFDYERGFFPSLGNDRSDPESKQRFLDVLEANKDKLAQIGAVVDQDGSLSIEEPGLPVSRITSADLSRWRGENTDLQVGKIFNPGDDTFATRAVLSELHETVRALLACFA